jgi:hypothetical protein
MNLHGQIHRIVLNFADYTSNQESRDAKTNLSTQNTPKTPCPWLPVPDGYCRRTKSIEKPPSQRSLSLDGEHEQPCQANQLEKLTYLRSFGESQSAVRGTNCQKQLGEAQVPPVKINRFYAGAAIWKILCPPAHCAGGNASRGKPDTLRSDRWKISGQCSPAQSGQAIVARGSAAFNRGFQAGLE